MTIKSTLPLLLACGTVLGASTTLAADTAAARLDRVEAGTAALARKVGYVQVAESRSDVSSAVAADFEVRLQRLEQTLSELTGRAEQSSYDIQQLKDRVERLSGDVDFRLQGLEKPGVGAGGGKAGAAPVVGARPSAADDSPVIGRPTKPTAPTPPEPASASGGLRLPGDKPAGSPAPAPALASTGDAQTDYDRAYKLLRTEDWDKAERAFSDFVKRYPKNPMSGNAQYWLGETFYVRKKYNEAAVAFAEGFRNYPTNNKAPDNLLKLGLAMSELGKTKESCTAYGELLQRFPGASPAIKRRADAERKRLGCK